MSATTNSPFPSLDDEALRACIHCGLCLGSCPTYQLTGDENNSPRGRLMHWRSINEGRLTPNEKTDFYTDECVGCLACETACPAQVPYGEILHEVRRQRTEDGKRLPWWINLLSKAVQMPALFDLSMMPMRVLRQGGFQSKFVFPGKPPVLQTSAQYAREIMAKVKPTGPTVALLSGCLMEGMFREINFATIRVLAKHNVRVIVPEEQTCCGAFLEHTGSPGLGKLQNTNRSAFDSLKLDAVIANSAGCGLTLSHTLKTPVYDITKYLTQIGVKQGRGIAADHIYIDLPCHLVHGQKEKGISQEFLDAIGTPWSLAPRATDCCGSGGTYNQVKEENAREILRGKSDFLNASPHKRVTVASSNHVCLMQWHSARKQHLVNRPYRVAHVIQLLDESLS